MSVKPNSLPHYAENTNPEWDVQIRNIYRPLTNCFAAMSAKMLQRIEWPKTAKADRYFRGTLGLFTYIIMMIHHNPTSWKPKHCSSEVFLDSTIR